MSRTATHETKCNFDMGGLWLEKAGSSFDYVAVECNDRQGHSGLHSHLDLRSGKVVLQQQDPTLVVDARGCVQDA